MFVMCRGTTCTFGRLTASGESVPEVTSFINTYTRDILLISQKKIEKSRIIIWPPTGCKKYGTIFFFFNGKKKTQAKLASASVTTWFNQRCVCRRFHSHFLHFFFSFFLSLQLLYYSSQRCVSASGRNMTSSPSLQSSSTQPPPTIPGCTLSAVIVHSRTYHFEKIVQMLLKPTIFRGCWSVSTASPARKERKKERKCGAVKLKKRMKAEHTSPRRCIILVDGSPVTLMLWTMNAPQDDKKTRAANLVCGRPRQKKETSTLQKCDWFFIYTRLSECREWM